MRGWTPTRLADYALLLAVAAALTLPNPGAASLWDVDEGVKELQRCARAGLKGAVIWASPPDDRPYSLPLYDPFWATAQEVGMPISLHSITGMGAESRLAIKQPIDRYVRSTVLCHEVQRTLVVLIFSGVLERFPRLTFVSAENEVGWIPFFVHEWDKYFVRHSPKAPLPYMKKLPGEYVRDHVYATFFSDPAGGRLMEDFGQDTFMWSNDYPHAASTWPHSRDVIARELGHLPKEILRKVVRDNVIKLYDLKIDGINN